MLPCKLYRSLPIKAIILLLICKSQRSLLYEFSSLYFDFRSKNQILENNLNKLQILRLILRRHKITRLSGQHNDLIEELGYYTPKNEARANTVNTATKNGFEQKIPLVKTGLPLTHASFCCDVFPVYLLKRHWDSISDEEPFIANTYHKQQINNLTWNFITPRMVITYKS